MDLIHSRVEEHIGILIMDHHERRNALSERLIDAMFHALEAFRAESVRVVILRAQPGASIWSAGHDVNELPHTRRDPLGYDDPLRRIIRQIAEFPAPVIALIEGGVWGGACEVAFACDLINATPDATFAITPAKLGIPYNISGLLTFMNAMPLHMVREMAFTARPLAAERAAELGVINHVVPAPQITAFCIEMARRIESLAPMAIAVMKEELRVLASAHSITPGMFERVQGLRRRVYDGADYQEGVKAFKEKRLPEFFGM